MSQITSGRLIASHRRVKFEGVWLHWLEDARGFEVERRDTDLERRVRVCEFDLVLEGERMEDGGVGVVGKSPSG